MFIMYLPYWYMRQWAFVPWKQADCTCSECNFLGLFSCDQAALRTLLSVCLSACPSHRFHYVSITVSSWNFQELLLMRDVMSMKFSGVITNDRRNVHAKGQGQRSKVKDTEVKIQLSRFRTVSPVWIHIRWWNDAQSFMLLRRGALLFFKVIRQIPSSQGYKIEFDPNWTFPDCNSSLNSPMTTNWCTKLDAALKSCLTVLQGHLSNFKVTQYKKTLILTQIGCFRTVTPVWIHWWLGNDAQSLKQNRRGALLFFKVIRQISGSHGT